MGLNNKRNNKLTKFAKSEKFRKQSARYSNKVEEYNKLTDVELNETLEKFKKREIKASALDKQAFIDVYQARYNANILKKLQHENKKDKEIDSE